MSVGRFLQQAAAGNAGEAVYVDDVFSTYLYQGTGSAQTITNGIDLDGEGGLVWIKNRDQSAGNAQEHILSDTERGVNKHLSTNNTGAEESATRITAFNTNGFSVSNSTATGYSGWDYTSWTFRKQPGFFDVVTYTGDNTTERQIPHSLGSTPGMIIVRATDNVENWAVWHRSVPDDSATRAANMWLNTTDAAGGYGRFANNSDQTSTYFTTGVSGVNSINYTGRNYIAYLFAHDAQDFGTNSDESIIKCGTYTGDGSASGLEVDLGFEPQWLLVKTASGSGTHKNWWLLDNMRGIPTGSNENLLAANLSDAETTGADICDLTASGFIAKNSSQANQNGMNYIYVAIRRPHKPASEFAATDLFAVDQGGTESDPHWESGFPVDMAWHRHVSTTMSSELGSRLTGTKYLKTDSTGAELNDTDILWDYMDGWYASARGSTWYSWMFRRAPGFFDVVTYTGTGSSPTTIDHNLGAVPEMMIIKARNKSSNWVVYHSGIGNTGAIYLQDIGDEITFDGFWNDTTPTDSVFTLGNQNDVNESGRPMIAYLFATVPGISKIGSYTGTSATQDIDCGFTNGARFVLVKRSSGNDPWILWDSERGIVSGNDPYLQLNSTAAQVTTTDYIDPLDSGFTLTAGIGDTNFTGQSYIFLAIA